MIQERFSKWFERMKQYEIGSSSKQLSEIHKVKKGVRDSVV